MGDKAAARRLATELGVPIVPGYDGADQSDAALGRAAAKRIGYPLLVKPAAGGGGKGMRVVREPARLADALAGARREAAGRVRRRPADPRAVRRGTAPRRGPGPVRRPRRGRPPRRARLLDPAPPPEGARGDAVPGGRRRRSGAALTDAALRLAGAVGYRSAGTCEFLLDGPRRDLLPRDEHAPPGRAPGDRARRPASTWSSRPAARRGGQAARARRRPTSIGAARRRARRRGPPLRRGRRGGLPAGDRAGRAARAGRRARASASTPASTRARPSASRFDPMLAKVIAHGADRAEALDRLTARAGRDRRSRAHHEPPIPALARPPAGGPRRPDAHRHPRRGSGRRTTGQARARFPTTPGGPLRRALAGAGWQGGWRLNGPPRVRLVAEGEERSIALDERSDGRRRRRRRPEVALASDVAHVDVAGRSVPFRLAPAPDVDRAARHAAGARSGGGPAEISPRCRVDPRGPRLGGPARRRRATRSSRSRR